MGTDITDSEIEQQRPKRSVAEWLSFSIASFILVVVVGLVGYIWIKENGTPPILAVSNQEPIREVDGKFYVPFEIVNTGGETAESVQIIAELQTQGEVAETGEQQIDFLSPNEKEQGAFIFSQDPRKSQLIIRVASYKLP